MVWCCGRCIRLRMFLTRVGPCEDLGMLCSDDLVLMSLITLTASLPISLASLLFSAVTLLTNTTLSRTFTKHFPSIVHVSVTNLSFLSCRARYAMPLRIFVRSSFMLTEWYSGLSFKFFLHFSMRFFTLESLRRTINWRGGKARPCSPTLTGFPIICDRMISDSLRSGSMD